MLKSILQNRIILIISIITILIILSIVRYYKLIVTKTVLKSVNENFINTITDNSDRYTNISSVKPLKFDSIETSNSNPAIIIHSVQPSKIRKIGIETNISIDYRIAKYFTNNIIPSIILENDTNERLITNILNDKLITDIVENSIDLAFIREYKLLSRTDIHDNINVIMPTFNKFILVLTYGNNKIDYIEDINNEPIYPRTEQNICYIHDDDLLIAQILMKYQKILPERRSKIVFKKINKLSELTKYDIFIGLVLPINIESEIKNLKLKPLYYIPKYRVPTREYRLAMDIKINEADVDDIREFHNNLKRELKWLLTAEIYPTASSQSYRTYRVRYLLICNKFNTVDMHTLINNWYEHRMILKNIYNLDVNKRRGYPHITNTFTDLSTIPSSLTIHPVMQDFLKGKKLLIKA